MPYTRHNAVANSANGSLDNLHEGMWQLKITDNNQDDGDDHQNQYPDRPGEPDCIYYLRTGMCGYGSKCKYNHPTYNGQGTMYRDELPQRDGQPDCQFFLKTGSCKFGSTCKYHHPRDKHDGRPIHLNALGLPMRKDEKPCPYYMRTTTCKFGIACKFNHPEPPTFGAVVPATEASEYGGYSSSSVTAAGPPIIGASSSVLLSRNPRIQGPPAYMPLVLSPSTMQQGWNAYMGNIGFQTGDAIVPTQLPNSNYHMQPGSSMPLLLPDRPDQPECQYYLRTGNCKYGTSCKFHHPQDGNQAAACMIGPLGLPLRPGYPVCDSYTTYGSCKYGTACKFDHPIMGYYNYPVPTFTVQESPVLLANIFTLTDNSSSKTVKAAGKLMKSEKIIELQDADDSGLQDNSELDNPSTQTSASHTTPHSDSPQNQSD